MPTLLLIRLKMDWLPSSHVQQHIFHQKGMVSTDVEMGILVLSCLSCATSAWGCRKSAKYFWKNNNNMALIFFFRWIYQKCLHCLNLSKFRKISNVNRFFFFFFQGFDYVLLLPLYHRSKEENKGWMWLLNEKVDTLYRRRRGTHTLTSKIDEMRFISLNPNRLREGCRH